MLLCTGSYCLSLVAYCKQDAPFCGRKIGRVLDVLLAALTDMKLRDLSVLENFR